MLIPWQTNSTMNCLKKWHTKTTTWVNENTVNYFMKIIKNATIYDFEGSCHWKKSYKKEKEKEQQ